MIPSDVRGKPVWRAAAAATARVVAKATLIAYFPASFVATAHARMAELGIDPASAKGKIIAVEAVVSASRGWFAQASAADRIACSRAARRRRTFSVRR